MMKFRILILLGFVAALHTRAEAKLELPHVFGDGMVLQQGRRLPVWGKSDPGEQVTVSFADQRVTATADDAGMWKLFLAPLEASASGRDFHVSTSSSASDSTSASTSLCLHDVVVGEVWFCSGQSNMEFPMGGLPWDATRRIKDSEREIAAANYPLLRHFKVRRATAKTPQQDVDATWEVTTPETVGNKSAVAYVFGETLLKELKVPVGLIDCSWGGTRIEAWTPAGHPDDLWLLQNGQKWNRAQDVPTVLWNGMVAGLVPYAIKGAIWYQGCQNRQDGEAYLEKTVSLVRGWRREWGQGDFPYFLVQLAPYKYDDVKGEVLSVIQRVQARVPERVANSGYTVINDVGNVNDIHPTDKRTVGMRLADQVLDRVYGRFVRPWKTPVATGVQVKGGEARIAFENAEGLKTRDGLAPTEFEFRDPSGTWRPAAARIEGTEVVLSLPAGAAGSAIASCQGVRFAPYNGSTPNLVNGAGLPAGPFVLKAGRRISLHPWGTERLHLSHVHRGGGKIERPDNTLATFTWCWENGSALECDCRKTKDGVGIMLHDDTLQRTARGIPETLAGRSVSQELTWEEIKDVDVGSYLGSQFAHHRIPTIEETFRAMKGHPTYLCFVDEKGAGPKYIADKAREAGVVGQVYYSGPSYEKAQEWMRDVPGGKTMLWIGTWPVPKPEHDEADLARFEAHYEKVMRELRAGGFKGVSVVSLHAYYNPKAKEPFVPRASYLRKLTEEFHQHGIPVCSIPFAGGETQEAYFKLWELGMDGFSSDYPSVMFRVIKKLKAWTNS